MEWTDERLDDLANRIDAGFAEVKRDSRESRQELKGAIEGLRADIEDLHRLMVQSAIAISVGLLGLLGTGAISLIAG